jgi:hypothetical protein
MIIYITGYARSGTTLLRRLFYSFKDVTIENQETYISEVEDTKDTEGIIVYKANRQSPLSNLAILPVQEEEDKLKALKEKGDVRIINIVRNGKYVHGAGTFASPEGWANCIRHFLSLRKYVDLNIYYDDLVTEPDKIQEQISCVSGLVPDYLFSEYPVFIPKDTENHERHPGTNEYQLRPIENKKKQYSHWKECSKPFISDFLRFCKLIDTQRL